MADPHNTPSRIAAGFVRVLRGLDMSVPVTSAIVFSEALASLGTLDRDSIYWAGRATMVHSPDDIALFDRAFRVFWEAASSQSSEPDLPDESLTLAIDTDDSDDSGGEGEPSDEQILELRFSSTEVLRQKDFSAFTNAELAEASELMREFALMAAPRRSLRLVPDQRQRGPRHDLRRTVRDAMRTGGEPLRLHRRRTGTRNRRLVLLLDVSGSMEPYARALIRFAHAALLGRQRVEVFALGTRLTRITRELSSRDPDRALNAASDRVLDYGGGTRLGEAIRDFNDEWGQRGMARGSVVVVLSDGWDRGDPELLGEQMQRLHRVAYKVVWVNPLKVTPGYAPLARGMMAALPHVDDFVEGHSIDALAELARIVAATDRTRPASSGRSTG